ncbi:MAG: LLM class flavin-dependent oxidoreductase [bacterium]|nr:LLM class flavin-dependent oxidoreductase [bacterium]
MALIKFGIELPNILPWPVLREAALTMDGQRWRGAWTYDHLMPCTAEELPLTVSSTRECEEGPILEGWTLLAAMAAVTKRIRLGTMVTSATMRHPALLCKEAVTVDHISGGRVDLGLGTGWHEHEHAAFGVPLGGLKTRCDRFEESAGLIHRLLNGPYPVTWQGQFFHLQEAPFAPVPVQEPLPLLLAGGGEKRILPVTAKYGEACNLYVNMFSSMEELRRKLKVLQELCHKVGRDYESIRKTVTMYADLIDDEQEAFKFRRFMGQHLYDEEADALPFGSAARIIEAIEPLIELGIDEVVFNGPYPSPEKLSRLDQEVLSAFD